MEQCLERALVSRSQILFANFFLYMTYTTTSDFCMFLCMQEKSQLKSKNNSQKQHVK